MTPTGYHSPGEEFLAGCQTRICGVRGGPILLEPRHAIVLLVFGLLSRKVDAQQILVSLLFYRYRFATDVLEEKRTANTP